MNAEGPAPRRVYLDHNASSPLRPEVARLLAEGLTSGAALGNPSSVHAEGRAARDRLEQARERLAAVIGCERDQLVFTSGGTEADNLALSAGRRPAAAATSHPAVLEPVRRAGGLVLPVHPDGQPRLDEPGDWDLLSVPHVHHETGHLLDLEVLVGATHQMDGLLHLDACQSLGRVPLDGVVQAADLVSLSAHKLGGPVGIGALVVGARARVEPLIHGGQQELGLRPGTEAAWLASGFARAAELAVADLPERQACWSRWQEELRRAARVADPASIVLTPEEGSAPHCLCLSFPGRPGSALVQRLDLDGVAVSHGSACASGSTRPSEALLAFGHDETVARGALRISMGHDTTDADVRRCGERLVAVVGAVSKRAHEAKKSPASDG